MSPLQGRKLVDLIDELDDVVDLLQGRRLQADERLLECLNNATATITTAIDLINDVRLKAHALTVRAAREGGAAFVFEEHGEQANVCS